MTLGIVLLVASRALAADPVPTLTLDDALDLLHRQNPEVLAGALRVRAAAGDVAAARVFPNPTVSLGAGNLPLGRTNPPGLGVRDTVVGQAGITEELVLWGKRGARMTSAQDRQAAAVAARADLDRRLTFEVRKAFVDLMIDDQRVRLAGDDLDAYRRMMRIEEARMRAGDLSAADFDKIALEARRFEDEAADAAIERQKAVADLLPLLGLEAPDVRVAGDLVLPPEPADPEALVRDALTRRPDLRAAEREAAAADAALALARAERFPNPTVGLQYTHSEFLISGDLANQLGASVSVPLPVLDRHRGEIERAEAEALIAHHEAAALRLAIPQEVRTAIASLAIGRRRVRRFEEGFLEQARTARRAAEVSYREGAISLLEFLEAERTSVETERDHLEARRDTLTAGFDVIRTAALEVVP